MKQDLDKVLSSLPNKRFYEYAYHKFFTEGVEYAHWQPDATWTYPDRDLLRFGEIITAQQEHIQGKRILDLGCHLGYVSLFCLHNQAKHVTGTNVRERELDIAREVCALAGYDNFQFLHSDIDDLTELGQLCDSVDTVFMCGLLYHLSNHMEVLKTIYASSASTLVIESEVHDRDPKVPSIVYRHEDTSYPTNKQEADQHMAFVGTPNAAWIKAALKHVGYVITYEQSITYVDPQNTIMNRYIITGNKED